jgi:protein subunit release factor B
MNDFQEKIVLPESDEKLLELCYVETFRSSGSGGQHVNKTDSAVRLTYRPKNIVVTCQEGRSQHFNKLRCIEKLREKVTELNYRKPKRIPTRIPKSKKEESLKKKQGHSAKKKMRGKIDFHD